MRAVPLRAVTALLFVSLAISSAAGAEQSGIAWRPRLEDAEKESAATGKPLLLQTTASWCTYCHKMLKSTFTDPEVIELINSNFVPVLIDADRNPKLVQALRIQSFPSTAVVSSDFQKIMKIAGYQKASRYRTQLTSIQVALAKSQVKTVAVAAADRAEGHRRADVPEAQASIETDTSVAPPATAPQPPAFGPSREKSPQAAFRGTCLVSLIADRKLVEGQSEYQVTHRGRVLYFASADARDRFVAQPAAFWPALDGVSPVDPFQSEGQPRFGVVYRGEVYFCGSAEELAKFQSSPAEFVSKAASDER